MKKNKKAGPKTTFITINVEIVDIYQPQAQKDRKALGFAKRQIDMIGLKYKKPKIRPAIWVRFEKSKVDIYEIQFEIIK